MAVERARPAPRFSNGELIYAIDVRETLKGFGTVINLLFRQRRKNGAWSKARPANVTATEVEHLPTLRIVKSCRCCWVREIHRLSG